MEGSRLLRGWMERKKLNQTKLAEMLGMHQSMVSDYLAGKKQPGVDPALAIAKATRGAVPVSSWTRQGAGA